MVMDTKPHSQTHAEKKRKKSNKVKSLVVVGHVLKTWFDLATMETTGDLSGSLRGCHTNS